MRNRTKSAGIIGAFLVAGCDRVDAQYDISGRYASCINRYSHLDPKTEAERSLAHGVHNLYLSSSVDPVAGVYAIGLRSLKDPGGPCDYTFNGVQSRKESFSIPTLGHGNTPALRCHYKIKEYEGAYNREMVRLFPAAMKSACIPDRFRYPGNDPVR